MERTSIGGITVTTGCHGTVRYLDACGSTPEGLPVGIQIVGRPRITLASSDSLMPRAGYSLQEAPPSGLPRKILSWMLETISYTASVARGAGRDPHRPLGVPHVCFLPLRRLLARVSNVHATACGRMDLWRRRVGCSTRSSVLLSSRRTGRLQLFLYRERSELSDWLTVGYRAVATAFVSGVNE